jgi:two-component system NarL family response regulator
LSDREIEILCLLAQGMADSEIAARACITEGTVRSHVSNLLTKLGLTNRTQAVIYALRRGLINLDF